MAVIFFQWRLSPSNSITPSRRRLCENDEEEEGRWQCSTIGGSCSESSSFDFEYHHGQIVVKLPVVKDWHLLSCGVHVGLVLIPYVC
eukprot:scaffold15423_cov46-Cyclotella_meneghiniana.AAC.4